ncbi:reverse transcriptase domain-containing protein [Tanacetum coccineum]
MTIPTSAVRNIGGRSGPQGLERPTPDEARLLYSDESRRNPRNHEESHYSESKTLTARAEPKRRHGNRRSRSPSPVASVFKKLKQNRPPSPRPRPRKEGGVFNRLGGKERSASARSDSRHQGSHEKETVVQSRKHHYRGTPSRETGGHSKSEDSKGGYIASPRPYNGSGDPIRSFKLFRPRQRQRGGQAQTWCHMFTSTLTGNARVWFDKLPRESIDSYEDLRTTFRENYLQQTKHIKDPVEIHHIKQRDGESTEDFMERYKAEILDVEGAPKCMKIFGFMHDRRDDQVRKIVAITEEEIIRDIAETFKTLRQINMKLNPKKCTFGMQEGMFLGYKVNAEGLKVCPDKADAVLSLPSPGCLKDVQKLNGKLASLNRFLSKSAEKSLPFFKTLKKCTKKSDFQWTQEAEVAFKQMKKLIAELPMLTAPKEKEELIIYLAAAKEAISAVLMTERGGKQLPVYFVSRALRGPEINYTPMEKLVLALLSASRRLKRYFQAHTIVVITDQPIKQLLSKSEISGRMLKWKFELEGYDIQYRPRTSIKGQILADFIVERPDEESPDELMAEPEELPEPWTLFTDGSSCIDGSGAGLILTNPEGVEFMYTMRFRFEATNNKAEYEALISGLWIAEQIGVKNLQANVDSRLVANQVNGSYVAKESGMVQYLKKVKTLASNFKEFSIKQVPRSENKKADALSKIASTSFAHLSKQVLVEELKEKSIHEKEVLAIAEEEEQTWMTPICEYLTKETLPEDKKKARVVRRKASRMHSGPRSVVAKAIRTRYYWPTMNTNARKLIRECNDCQVYRPIPRNPQQNLTPITSLWPFYKWGIDIAGPFPEGPGKVKFLIVAIEYFTKWIKAKPVATITGNQVKKFVWDNIVCRFGLPGEIVSDNGKQFRDNPFKDWCEKLCIRQCFASVKLPQANGLVERANMSLGEGIKARLDERSKD